MMEKWPYSDLSTNYADPVRRLLITGEARGYDPAEWLDYAAEFGLGSEHIAELIRLACDVALQGGEPDGSVVWAPVHAWRALGQLQATESVAPLLAFLKTAEEDEADEELPLVFGMIGPAAIPSIAGFLSDRSNPISPVVTAMAGLTQIVARHPECRGECVSILARMLERHSDADRLINGFVVWELIDLAAVEAIHLMREAFRRNSVDVSVVGDEEDVEIALGLRERRAAREPFYHTVPPDWSPRRGKIGRNDPCPCGSGKKYKKCCLR